MARLVRGASGLLLACGLSFLFGAAAPASANDVGGWKYQTDNTNGNCLTEGTYLYSSPSPVRRSISAVDMCPGSPEVYAEESLWSSSGQLLNECDDISLDGGGVACSLAISTPSGAYWSTYAEINTGSNIYVISCGLPGDSASKCYQSVD